MDYEEHEIIANFGATTSLTVVTSLWKYPQRNWDGPTKLQIHILFSCFVKTKFRIADFEHDYILAQAFSSHETQHNGPRFGF